MKLEMGLPLQHEQQRTFGQRLSLQGNRTHPQCQARCDQDLPSFSFGAKSKCPKQCLAMPSTQHLTSKVSFRGIPIKYKPKVLNTGSSKHKFANACASFVFFFHDNIAEHLSVQTQQLNNTSRPAQQWRAWTASVLRSTLWLTPQRNQQCG